MLERVLTAAAEWVWVPPDAHEVTTPEYRLTHYSDRSSVQWSRTGRPLPDLVAEVRALARAAGRPRLRWWVGGASEPAGTPEALEALGFALVEVVDVLALDLRAGPDDLVDRLEVPGDVEVVPADDAPALRLAGRLSAEVFGWDPPSEVQLAHSVQAAAAGLGTGRWSERQFLAHLDGEPVGAAGCTLVGDLVRLWGGAVIEPARGRGAYRALLAARCRFAAEHGATLALVKGRVGTSGPVLRRAGFTAYGQERCYEASVPR